MRVGSKRIAVGGRGVIEIAPSVSAIPAACVEPRDVSHENMRLARYSLHRRSEDSDRSLLVPVAFKESEKSESSFGVIRIPADELLQDTRGDKKTSFSFERRRQAQTDVVLVGILR